MDLSIAIPDGHPLDGVRAKLVRAEEHIAAFERAAVAFLDTEPYVVHYERKPDGREHVFTVEVRRNAPTELSVVVGDCLQNMRSALDHLAWQLALLSGKRATPTRQTSFPVCETPEAFRAKGTKNKVADLTAEHREMIRELQPFHLGSAAKRSWLWHLNELARIDRHRTLHVVGGIQDEFTYSTRKVGADKPFGPYTLGQLGQHTDFDLRFRYEPFEDGMEVAGFVLSPPHPEVEMHVDATFTVTFGEDVGIPYPYGIAGALKNILEHVHADVLPPFVDLFGVVA